MTKIEISKNALPTLRAAREQLERALISAADVVDDANVYHLWVLPAGYRLPFGLTPEVRT